MPVLTADITESARYSTGLDVARCIEHVGIGSDYSFDHEDFDHELRIHPEAFSEMYTRWGPLQWVPPESTLTLPAVLHSRGFDDKAVDAVFGGNFRRVAQATHAATGR